MKVHPGSGMRSSPLFPGNTPGLAGDGYMRSFCPLTGYCAMDTIIHHPALKKYLKKSGGVVSRVSWTVVHDIMSKSKETVMSKSADTKKEAKKKPAKTAKEKKLAKQDKKKSKNS